ncbi:hypothetical protein HK405_011879, partial [Cladochytrium tenue]
MSKGTDTYDNKGIESYLSAGTLVTDLGNGTVSSTTVSISSSTKSFSSTSASSSATSSGSSGSLTSSTSTSTSTSKSSTGAAAGLNAVRGVNNGLAATSAAVVIVSPHLRNSSEAASRPVRRCHRNPGPPGLYRVCGVAALSGSGVLAAGLNLIHSLEDVTGEPVGKHKRAMLPVHRIDNIAVALNFLAKRGINTYFLTPQ